MAHVTLWLAMQSFMDGALPALAPTARATNCCLCVQRTRLRPPPLTLLPAFRRACTPARIMAARGAEPGCARRDDEARRKEKRKARNRTNARESRKRQKLYVAGLEAQVAKLEAELSLHKLAHRCSPAPATAICG